MNNIVAIEAERMIDARGGPPVEPAVVVVEGERITAAGSPAQIKVPEGATRIALGARTLLPGLIDAHVHLKGWRSSNPNDILITPHPLAALRAAADCRKLLHAGFTTVRDCGGCLGPNLRDAIAAREIPGPRILTAYRGLSQTGRVEKVTWAADITPLRQEVDGVDECRRVVREHIGLGADLIKVSITGRVYAPQSDPGQTAYTLDEIRAVVDEAHRMGRLVAAHAQATQGIKNGVLAGVDSIEHGIYLDEEACELMRERKTALVPTLAYFYRIATLGEGLGSPAYAVRKAREVVDAHMKSFALAMRMGLRIGMGTDFEGSPLFPHGENGMELELMVQGGMSAGDVIVAATATNAAILGIEKKLGTIATGKIADLIAVPGNPLKEISSLRRVEFVMQGGRVACSRIPDVAEIS
ncbi:MAG: amidohydrolase family protein [Deltaproteobacteria bacterium]|nr:amidohydrolase family protein [Deltaproteobacteria bacterium]MDZ4343853.1 amidohydrolase family protein [Candidatus Binatia bacterium]